MKITRSNLLSALAIVIIIVCFLRFDAIFNGASRFIPLRAFPVLLMVIFLLSFVGKLKFKLNQMTLLFAMPGLLILFTGEQISEMARNLYSYIYFFGYILIFSIAINSLDFLFLRRIISFFLSALLPVFMLEAYVRFFIPELGVNDQDITNLPDEFSRDMFYYFKYGSIMFYDSNYTGLALISIFILAVKAKFQVRAFLYFSLIIISLSRSVIITSVLLMGWEFLKYNDSKFYGKLFFIVALFSGLIYIYPYFIEFLSGDSSFETKVNIFANIFSRVNELNIRTLLFGGGYESGGFLFSPNSEAYAHALIPLLLGQVGMIGFAIYIIILYYLYDRLPGAQYWIVAFVITGFSLSDPFEPYYFLPMLLYSKYHREWLKHIHSDKLLMSGNRIK